MSTENPLMSLPRVDDARILRVIAVGSSDVVNNYVVTQHRLGFAEVSEWSRPLPAPTNGDIMRILTKRFGSESAE